MLIVTRRLHSLLLHSLLLAAVVVAVSPAAALRAAPPAGQFANQHCEGVYKGHLQGICTNGQDAVFWCFTTELVKTDRDGQVLKKVPVASHHGDLCYVDGKLYVAVNLGQFNTAEGRADSWVYVYDAGTLAETARHKLPEMLYGAGGMDYHNGQFIVIGGLPPGVNENYAYQYDADFKFVKRHVIDSGYTLMGIQTAAYAGGHWWFGCYGKPRELLKTDENFHVVGKYEFDASYGIVPLPDGSFLIGQNTVQRSEPKTNSGKAVVADADAAQGLVIRKDAEKQ